MLANNDRMTTPKLDGYGYYAFTVLGSIVTWYHCSTLNYARYLVGVLKTYKPDLVGYNDERMTWQNCLDYSHERGWIVKMVTRPNE